MSHSNIVDKIIDYESGTMSQDDVVEFFQELIDTETINGLQGFYQRQARYLIESGLVHVKET